jgi:hypothetical protein
VRPALLGLALVLGTWGCGSATPPPGRRFLEERFDAPEVADARRVAPDLVAAAERARDEAERARARGDEDAAADETTRARLLLEAALVEARRIREERARQQAENEVSELLATAMRDEAARAAIERENTRRAALAVLQEELARAIARAEATEPRRGARLPSGDPSEAARAAQALAARARLLLGAAMVLGAPAEDVVRAESALERHGLAAADPQRALAAADEARRAAETALGRARARVLGGEAPRSPSAMDSDAVDAIIASVAEDAQGRGLEAHATERGLVLSVPAAFVGSSAAPAAGVAAALAAVVRTAPGPVRIWVDEGTNARNAPRTARRALGLLEALVAAGVPRDRLSVEPVPPRLPDVQRLPGAGHALAARPGAEAPRPSIAAGVLLPLLGPTAALAR